MSEAAASRPLRLRDVQGWDLEHDVVVVGLGAAGGAAAIEAARAGADTVVLERMMAGGGTTALSTGLTYFGGGTAIQKACGFEDSVRDMQACVKLAAGAQADPERVRLYCEGSVGHFEWFREIGVEYKESYLDDKVTHPLTDDCLMFSGNEDAWPFRDQTRPVPRGHKPARAGEAGAYLMQVVIRGCEEAGAKIVCECRAERLVCDDEGRAVGLAVRLDSQPALVKARRGVVLATGGFIMNREMVARHAPDLLQCNYPLGTPADDGSGILMGTAAGADAINMDEGLVLNAYYPPSSHLKGVLVDALGRRFINEDSYIGRASDAILAKADGRAYLIVDNEICGRTQAGHKLAAVEETFGDLEKALDMPSGVLVHTLEHYNRHAARGEDPLFHKAPKELRPLSVAPFAALDCSTDNSIFGALTLGGLAVNANGEVLDPRGQPIGGLYAAGRCTAGLCREGRTYASGLSIGEASFFGRLAGVRAAQAAPWCDGAG
jgi:3-oxo-5alpha-steroid 4-dehydrogenase